MVRTVDEAALEANFAGVKGAIRVEQVAELETHLRRTGAHLKGLCPLPDHDEMGCTHSTGPQPKSTSPTIGCRVTSGSRRSH